MIIADDNRKNKFRAGKILAISLGVMALFVLAVIFVFFPKRSLVHSREVVFCGAEKIRKGKFVNASNHFSNGNLKSSERARSGSYSCKVARGDGVQYGFSYNMTEFQAGEVYRASVWRYKDQGAVGRLAVNAQGRDNFYLQEGFPAQKEGTGWELLEIRFHIPYGKKLDHINVHVYTDGLREVFFDDLKIEKIDIWQATNFQPEVLDLQIKPDALKKLERNRAEALKTGILEASEKDWVNARILLPEKEPIGVTIRLKGDWLDHLRGDKWSFRIKVKAPYNWKRMISFSVHTPSARYYLHEWLLHKFWQKEDVLTPTYDFIELKLNGHSLGIYAFEEHFEKQLLESRHRREGPILKFSEDGFWSGIKRQLSHHGYIRNESGLSVMEWDHADIRAFQEAKTTASPTLSTQFEEARTLMQQYKSGLKKPGEIFELDLLAKYFATCDALNAYHGIIWHNQRYYYNPLTAKLEPVGFDGYGDEPEKQFSFLGQGAFNPAKLQSGTIFSHLFLDPEFVEKYIQYLYRFTKREYLHQFFDEIYAEWVPRLQFIQQEFPKYDPKLTDFARRAAYVHSLILPFNDNSLKAFTQLTGAGRKTLQLSNTHSLPIAVLGYGLTQRELLVKLDTPILIPGHIPRKFLLRMGRDSVVKIEDFNSLRFLEEAAIFHQEATKFHSLEVPANARFLFFKLPGLDWVFHSKIFEWASPDKQLASQEFFQSPLFGQGKIFELKENKITFKKGSYSVDKDIVIPKGYQVFFEEGVQLDFVAQSAFFSQSPLQMFGSAEEPIKIFSSDKSGGSFSVFNCPEPSILNYVIFEDQQSLKKGKWELTGAVNFYESEASIHRCVFRKNHCEDALNIIRSEFIIDHCQFTGISSDAFDGDFCKGEISNSLFRNIVNDGMDFSGSIVNIKNCTLENCGDKGISAGEESDVTVFSTSIKGAPIALASKDLSVLFARDIILSDCDQGFVAFQKKAAYGGGRILVESYTAQNVKRLYAVAKGSSLQLEQEVVEPGE